MYQQEQTQTILGDSLGYAGMEVVHRASDIPDNGTLPRIDESGSRRGVRDRYDPLNFICIIFINVQNR